MIEILPDDDLGVNNILDQAKEDNLDYVLVIGRKEDGWYFASNDPDAMKASSAAQHFLNYAMSS